MRSLTKIATLAAILGAVTAIAAPNAGPTQPPPPSVADMIAKSAAIEGKIADDSRFMLHLQELAKKQKDVIKLACVNDKLVELKAQQNIADGTNTQLQAAIQNNSDDRFKLFGDLESTGQSIDSLREQASACIGENELLKQESGVDVEHPEITEEPPVGPPEPEVEAPGYASPFH